MVIQLYEGSLRNLKQLLRELGLTEDTDRHETECRVIEAGFQRWGYELPCHLYGSFAFAVWDEIKEELFCARDAFGIQNMYYCVTDDGTFLYGSSLSTILENPGCRKSLDKDALQLYTLFGYLIGEKTLYKGISKLMPGYTLVWDGRSVRTDRWYTISFHPDQSVSEDEWMKRIDQTLQAILDEDRFRFNFSECHSFLSGGVDSSYLLASSGVPEAIGIGFEGNDPSEISIASDAAEKIGARFSEVKISAEQFFEVIPRFLRNMELPLADGSAPAFALGCEQAAKKRGSFFSGEGADEFFAGYYVYRRMEELGREDALYFGCDGIMDQKNGMRLLKTGHAYPLEKLVEEIRSQTHDADPLSRMLAVDMSLWLEGDILFGVGRSARANGIELLLPFADRRMFELSAAIPSSLKRKDDIAKYIFRKAAQTRIPHEFAFRPKVGFSVPVRKWFREKAFRSRIEQVLFGSYSKAFFDQELLHDFWDSFLNGNDGVWNRCYMVYIFVLWYENCFA